MANVFGQLFAARPGIGWQIGHAEPFAQSIVEERIGGGLAILGRALRIERPPQHAFRSRGLMAMPPVDSK